jgi:bromodomain adjacent to zinc finger domain protein 1A
MQRGLGRRAGWLLEGCKWPLLQYKSPLTLISSQHANLANFPHLRVILTRLLFAPESSEEPSVSSMSSRTSSPVSPPLTIESSPGERYYTLPYADKILILSFMCNLAISSKAIHMHMESCEEQLTALRKEKIEVNRQKKA